eukprot:PLAT13518.1.p1 GENE.PLAT13518.1~~PLAT13518.1.p1  ORF type:complete len:273 (+),score=118.18 PLAT13518.1:427-1245(+)
MSYLSGRHYDAKSRRQKLEQQRMMALTERLVTKRRFSRSTGVESAEHGAERGVAASRERIAAFRAAERRNKAKQARRAKVEADRSKRRKAAAVARRRAATADGYSSTVLARTGSAAVGSVADDGLAGDGDILSPRAAAVAAADPKATQRACGERVRAVKREAKRALRRQRAEEAAKAMRNDYAREEGRRAAEARVKRRAREERAAVEEEVSWLILKQTSSIDAMNVARFVDPRLLAAADGSSTRPEEAELTEEEEKRIDDLLRGGPIGRFHL